MRTYTSGYLINKMTYKSHNVIICDYFYAFFTHYTQKNKVSHYETQYTENFQLFIMKTLYISVKIVENIIKA